MAQTRKEEVAEGLANAKENGVECAITANPDKFFHLKITTKNRRRLILSIKCSSLPSKTLCTGGLPVG